MGSANSSAFAAALFASLCLQSFAAICFACLGFETSLGDSLFTVWALVGSHVLLWNGHAGEHAVGNAGGHAREIAFQHEKLSVENAGLRLVGLFGAGAMLDFRRGNAHFPSVDAALLSDSNLSMHHGLRNSAAFAAAFFAPLCFEILWGKTRGMHEKMRSGNPLEFLRKPSGIH